MLEKSKRSHLYILCLPFFFYYLELFDICRLKQKTKEIKCDIFFADNRNQDAFERMYFSGDWLISTMHVDMALVWIFLRFNSDPDPHEY